MRERAGPDPSAGGSGATGSRGGPADPVVGDSDAAAPDGAEPTPSAGGSDIGAPDPSAPAPASASSDAVPAAGPPAPTPGRAVAPGPTPWMRQGLIRAFEIALILVGLGFVLLSDTGSELLYLAIWDALAFVYIVAGAIVLRRTRRQPAATAPMPVVGHRFRMNFAFAIIASLTGFFAALHVAIGDFPDDDYEVALDSLAAMAMLFSWMLLQAGYGRRYAAMFRSGAGGLVFPNTPHPAAVDFLYFATTVGTAFSVSDVLVTTARMRWHVMVHSVVSFIYNAAVLAFAINLITGR